MNSLISIISSLILCLSNDKNRFGKPDVSFSFDIPFSSPNQFLGFESIFVSLATNFVLQNQELAKQIIFCFDFTSLATTLVFENNQNHHFRHVRKVHSLHDRTFCNKIWRWSYRSRSMVLSRQQTLLQRLLRLFQHFASSGRHQQANLRNRKLCRSACHWFLGCRHHRFCKESKRHLVRNSFYLNIDSYHWFCCCIRSAFRCSLVRCSIYFVFDPFFAMSGLKRFRYKRFAIVTTVFCYRLGFLFTG